MRHDKDTKYTYTGIVRQVKVTVCGAHLLEVPSDLRMTLICVMSPADCKCAYRSSNRHVRNNNISIAYDESSWIRKKWLIPSVARWDKFPMNTFLFRSSAVC